jgi:hypothetical protein
MRLNPHLHVVFLDGAYYEEGDTLVWRDLGHLQTREVGAVLETALRRMERYLRRRGLVELDGAAGQDSEHDSDPTGSLSASAVSGQEPPAGPQFVRRLSPLAPHELSFDKPLCVSLDGFTLHAATRARASDALGREALLRYVLRPPVAQERVELRKDGLVRIALKRAYADGTCAVDLELAALVQQRDSRPPAGGGTRMDPLSLLCRLAASVPPPRFHTVKYAGVLASASPWRSRIGPRSSVEAAAHVPPTEADDPESKRKRHGYRPWAELLRRAFGIDVLTCPTCKARMKLVAMLTEPASIARFLNALGEPTSVPLRSPPRGPPYCKSILLRRKALGDAA